MKRDICLVVLSCLLAGCGGRRDSLDSQQWREFVKGLRGPDRIARLDVDDSRIITSFDPTGGNDDFNHFLRKGPKGWWVLADLKGPGYISRFWFTGAVDGTHRLRFYFDGERKPRIDTDLDEFCGGYEQYCWHSFVPVPYSKSLVVMAAESPIKDSRLFYQINYSSLSQDQEMTSFPRKLTEEDRKLIVILRRDWEGEVTNRWGISETANIADAIETLEHGGTMHLGPVSGPAIIKRLRITPDFSTIKSALARERVLRDLVLRISWDGSAFSSVEAPLGDFFGSMWRRIRYNSNYFGLTGNTFESRFPMPFKSSAEITLENQGPETVSVKLSVVTEPMNSWDSAWGYFHSGWHRTTPENVGSPHPILKVEGRGKYVGCILGVASLDNSFWILEGDETIRKDDETLPGWRGTGLEDYFNCGWYYQNVMARPLHGIVFKAPFRTVQYRLHLNDPVLFESSLDMVFERGPDHASRGWMESVAFYYMDRPVRAFSRLGKRDDRLPPMDPRSKATVMPELWNYERFDDYQGATEFVDEFLEQYPDFPFADVLRLRQIAYAHHEDDFSVAKPAYEKFLTSTTNAHAVGLAKTELWRHGGPSRALLGVYCNTKTGVFLDGRKLGDTVAPDRIKVWGINLKPGRHVLALQENYHPYPDWVQACLRTHSGDVITSPEWKWALDPFGNWASLDYDDSSWREVGGTGVKGPPEEPFVWVVPDAFVDMQSKAVGLRLPPPGWQDSRGTAVYRHVFEIP